MAQKSVSFHKGQKSVHGNDQSTCANHKSETLDWCCETCDVVICAKCLSTSHKGHDAILLSEVTPANKLKIKTFINETEKEELVAIQTEIKFTQHSLDDHLNHSENVVKEVKKQGEKLKEDSDALIAETLSQLKHLEEETTKALTSYKTELEKSLADLNEQLKKCQETLQVGTGIQVYDLAKKLNANITVPKKPDLRSAAFIPNHTRNEIMGAAFGKVIVTPSGHSLILSEWKPPCKTNSLCPKNGGGVWTNGNNKVAHLNSQGDIKQVIKCGIHLAHMSVSPTTHNLWLCDEISKDIAELVSGEEICRFKTKNKPRCVCVTRDEKILVGSKHRITEYTPRGDAGIITKTSLFKKPIVCSPRRISQCPLTNNLAVVDRDEEDDGGKDKPTVIILNRELKELYRYEESQHDSDPDKLTLDPWDLTYDGLGSLVVADFNNNCLHLLSGDGQNLRLLHTDTDRPWNVCLDEEGVIWAVFGSDKIIKRLHYLRI